MNGATQHFFVKDAEHPYVQEKPFAWIRGYQVGGKSLLWARWTQRWSDLDYEANAKQGIAVDWPIAAEEITLSDRDRAAPLLAETEPAFRFEAP